MKLYIISNLTFHSLAIVSFVSRHHARQAHLELKEVPDQPLLTQETKDKMRDEIEQLVTFIKQFVQSTDFRRFLGQIVDVLRDLVNQLQTTVSQTVQENLGPETVQDIKEGEITETIKSGDAAQLAKATAEQATEAASKAVQQVTSGDLDQGKESAKEAMKTVKEGSGEISTSVQDTAQKVTGRVAPIAGAVKDRVV
jgi:hypothetical protein